MRLSPRVGSVLRRAFDRSVHVAAQAMYLLPATRPQRHGIRVLRDIPYRDSGLSAHLLDVYLPDESASPNAALRPVVMYVHGGAFCMLSKDTHRVMAMPFAKRGYVVFNINYRLGPVHTYPDPLEDAVAALLWVLDHARDYGGDPERIILAGESAGGNLVTALTYLATHPTDEPFGRALRARAPKIRAAVPIYGLLDLVDIERLTERDKVPQWAKTELRSAVAAYVGRPTGESARRHPLASPLRLFEAAPPEGAAPLPPFFLAVGTADLLLDDSRRLQVAIEKRGGKAELHVFPGEVHGFNAMVWRPAAKAKWRALFKFLADVAGVPPVTA